jgi:hypothetical protein
VSSALSPTITIDVPMRSSRWTPRGVVVVSVSTAPNACFRNSVRRESTVWM